MNCPHCNVELKMTERQKIEVDYCPKCRGIWLDRGELDKLLEAGAGERAPSGERYDDRREYRSDRIDNRQEYKEGYPRKRKSFLSEIFDF
jgi:Zn-finger nucleic acid-binding protein